MDNAAAVSPRYLKTSDAARYLSVSEEALRAHRSRGTGPRFARMGHKTVLYAIADLDAWVTGQLVGVEPRA